MGLGGGCEGEIVGEADGGDAGSGNVDAQVFGVGPAVDRLEEDVQQVGARGAALGKAVGSVLNGPIDLFVTKMTTEPSIEGLEEGHQLWGHSGTAKGVEEGPPGEGVVALFDVEARKPERGSPTAL